MPQSSRETESMVLVCIASLDFCSQLMDLVNWYRTRKVNFDDDLSILGRGITIPTLFILALRDPAVPPAFAKYMGKLVPGVVIKEVDTSHWALIEKPAEVNGFISAWLNDVGFSHHSAEKL